jgi:hypothetical protein
MSINHKYWFKEATASRDQRFLSSLESHIQPPADPHQAVALMLQQAFERWLELKPIVAGAKVPVICRLHDPNRPQGVAAASFTLINGARALWHVTDDQLGAGDTPLLMVSSIRAPNDHAYTVLRRSALRTATDLDTGLLLLASAFDLEALTEQSQHQVRRLRHSRAEATCRPVAFPVNCQFDMRREEDRGGLLFATLFSRDDVRAAWASSDTPAVAYEPGVLLPALRKRAIERHHTM